MANSGERPAQTIVIPALPGAKPAYRVIMNPDVEVTDPNIRAALNRGLVLAHVTVSGGSWTRYSKADARRSGIDGFYRLIEQRPPEGPSGQDFWVHPDGKVTIKPFDRRYRRPHERIISFREFGFSQDDLISVNRQGQASVHISDQGSTRSATLEFLEASTVLGHLLQDVLRGLVTKGIPIQPLLNDRGRLTEIPRNWRIDPRGFGGSDKKEGF